VGRDLEGTLLQAGTISYELSTRGPVVLLNSAPDAAPHSVVLGWDGC